MSRPLFLGQLVTALVLAAPVGAATSPAPPRVTGVVNLNTATPEQLKMLPGVKDKAVAEIVAHRAKHPFSRPEELVKVKGFSSVTSGSSPMSRSTAIPRFAWRKRWRKRWFARRCVPGRRSRARNPKLFGQAEASGHTPADAQLCVCWCPCVS